MKRFCVEGLAIDNLGQDPSARTSRQDDLTREASARALVAELRCDFCSAASEANNDHPLIATIDGSRRIEVVEDVEVSAVESAGNQIVGTTRIVVLTGRREEGAVVLRLAVFESKCPTPIG